MSKGKGWEKRLLKYKREIYKSPELYERMTSVIHESGCKDVLSYGYLLNYVPVIEDFVRWLLNHAVRNEKKRLYFLARDGYQPYLIAIRMCELYNLPLECRYLKCSRYSLRLPVYAVEEEQVYKFTCMGGIGVTFQKMMRRAGLPNEEGILVAKELGMVERYTEQLSYQQVKELEPLLRGCDYFIQRVRKHAASQYTNAIGYLRQEGLLDNVSYAIVDSGWTGSMQKCLSLLLDSAGKKKEIEGYYFGLYELPRTANRNLYHAYWFSPEKGIRRKVCFSNSLFETVISAPEGMTVAYGLKDGRYYAIKGVRENNLNCGEIELFTKILKSYLEQMDSSKKCQGTDKKVIAKLLKLCMCNPTAEEAEAFGRLEFSDDVLEEQTQELAQVYTKRELKKQNIFSRILIFLGLRHMVIKESAWMEGSVVRSDIQISWQLLQVTVYKILVYIKKRMGGKEWVGQKRENNTDL